jgi:hypothetical protein
VLVLLLQVAKAAKHEQHVAVCVVKVVLLPGVNTPTELEAAAAAAAAAAAGAGSSGPTAPAAAKKGKAAAADASGKQQSKQGSIRAFLRPTAKAPADAAAAAAGSSGANQQQQVEVELTEADVMAAGGAAHFLLVQRPPTGLLAGLWEFPGRWGLGPGGGGGGAQ